MKSIKRMIISLALVLGVGAGVLLPAVSVGAVNVFDEACNGVTNSAVCSNTSDNAESLIKKVVNILLYILGAAAVVVIVIAGITYTVSGGDSGSVTRAKNMLLYAVIGLIVAVLAYAIVNFVLTSFK